MPQGSTERWQTGHIRYGSRLLRASKTDGIRGTSGHAIRASCDTFKFRKPLTRRKILYGFSLAKGREYRQNHNKTSMIRYVREVCRVPVQGVQTALGPVGAKRHSTPTAPRFKCHYGLNPWQVLPPFLARYWRPIAVPPKTESITKGCRHKSLLVAPLARVNADQSHSEPVRWFDVPAPSLA